ncbi:S9 family peptidase [Candidatus Thorarchaeota archaeon]|nr:MAG: S9 family peptidase [Candidatus Thorarchaeota archaeon]
MTSKTQFEDYLAIELAGGPSWHPNGKALAFTSNVSGTYQIYSCEVLKGKTMPRKQLTNEEDRCTDPRYLPDGTLLFTRDRGGDENFQFGLIDENEKLHWITSDLGAKHRIGLITESYLYFSANLIDKAQFDVYRWKLPLLDSKPELLLRPPRGLVQVTGSSEEENLILMTQFISNMEQHLLLLDVINGKLKDLTVELCDSPTRWDVIRWFDNDTILVATDFDSDMKRLGLLKTTKEFNSITEIEDKVTFEVEDQTAYSKDSIWTYFLENQEGYSTIHRLKFQQGSMNDFETLSFPLRGVVPSGDDRSWNKAMSLSPDEHMLALTVSSGILTTSVWLMNIRDMSNWLSTEVSTSGIDRSTFIEPTLYRFASFDSLSIPYFRYIPDGNMPVGGWPTIFVIHGGPESQIRPDFNPVIQFFLSSGFAVVTPNIRGSAGYGRRYLDLDNVEKRLDSIKDIQCLALHIKENDSEINDEKLIIYGGSYGGFAVLSAMVEFPELWKAGIDIVGISNFVTFLQNTAAWRRSLREGEYGSLKNDMDTLIRISPIHKIDKIAAPLFIIQGDNDERVPLSESIQIYEKLKEKGLPVRLMRFADEGHGLAKLRNKIDAYSEVLDWLREIV